jgi:hypothetical protein
VASIINTIEDMKKIYLLIAMVGMSIGGYCQQGEWTWMNGADTANSLGVYGIQGVFDTLNSPPSVYEACEWTDLQGNFWLFGGWGAYSDLWEFKPTINEWAWIKGPGIQGQFGIYGTRGIPSPTNNPGARGWGVTTWVDTSGNLWLFGGQGYASTGNGNSWLNDLWKYDIQTNEWTWMMGSDTILNFGHYGIQGIPDPLNNPLPRSETNASWTDNNNNLWIFGGWGINPNHQVTSFNSLWRFSININEWTWMKGSVDTLSLPPIYGSRGIEDSLNLPGGRMCWTKWKDNNDYLWLYGGSMPQGGMGNDLWRYNINTNSWTWMNGDTTNPYFIDGTRCIPAISNNPGYRTESRTCWKRNNDFELFGGMDSILFNDLWDYNLITNEWTLMSSNGTGNYGTKLISSSSNLPNARAGSLGWKDNNGNLWMFGGTGGNFNSYNDMWRFVPDTTCPITTGIPKLISTPPAISLYPNPNNGTFTLHSQLSILNCQLKVMDVLGRTIYSYNIDNMSIINCQLSIESGIYFWEVMNDSGILANGKLAIIK